MANSVTDDTIFVRAGLGIAFFAALGLWDLWRHPQDPRRAKEYLFLFSVTGVAMAWAVVHDFVTYHLSPEYFIFGKGLADATDGFGAPVVKLALLAGWSPGLIAGAVLLLSNNRDRFGRQVSYGMLWRYAFAILLASAGTAVVAGCIFFWGSGRIAAAIDLPLAGESASRFVTVWGIHIGTYAGAVLGLVGAAVGVFRRKRRISPSDDQNMSHEGEDFIHA